MTFGFSILLIHNGRLVINMLKGKVENELLFPTKRRSKPLSLLQEWSERTLAFSPVVFGGRGIFQYNWGIVPFR